MKHDLKSEERVGCFFLFYFKNIRLRKQASKQEAGKCVARELYQELLTAGNCRTWIVIRNLWETPPPAADPSLCLGSGAGRGFYQKEGFSFYLNFLDILINFPVWSCWFLTNFKYFRKEIHSVCWEAAPTPAGTTCSIAICNRGICSQL